MTSKKPTKKARPSKRPSKAVTKPYEPTQREIETIATSAERSRGKTPAPRLKVTEKNNVLDVRVDHPDLWTGTLLFMAALATNDQAFLDGIVQQLVNAGSEGGQVDERGINFMLSMVKGIEPRDQVETMLAAQMAAVHNATMTYARRLNTSDTFMEVAAAERTLNKLARTFTTQVAALKQYRTGGQQKMTIEHIHVHEGGQAIVGNVQGGGGVTKKGEPTP